MVLALDTSVPLRHLHSVATFPGVAPYPSYHPPPPLNFFYRIAQLLYGFALCGFHLIFGLVTLTGENGDVQQGTFDGGFYGAGGEYTPGADALGRFVESFTADDFSAGQLEQIFRGFTPVDLGGLFDVDTFKSGDFGTFAVVGDEYRDFGAQFVPLFGEGGQRTEEAVEAAALLDGISGDDIGDDVGDLPLDVVVSNVQKLDFEGIAGLDPSLVRTLLSTTTVFREQEPNEILEPTYYPTNYPYSTT